MVGPLRIFSKFRRLHRVSSSRLIIHQNAWNSNSLGFRGWKDVLFNMLPDLRGILRIVRTAELHVSISLRRLVSLTRHLKILIFLLKSLSRFNG